jgi:hypothetical protein
MGIINLGSFIENKTKPIYQEYSPLIIKNPIGDSFEKTKTY